VDVSIPQLDSLVGHSADIFTVQGAIDWLDKNQDKSIDEIKEAQVAASDEAPELKVGEEAKSLQCDDCGRRLRSVAQAEWHASKT
jgi:hypothetical protein